jgi:hypothetical protein
LVKASAMPSRTVGRIEATITQEPEEITSPRRVERSGFWIRLAWTAANRVSTLATTCSSRSCVLRQRSSSNAPSRIRLSSGRMAGPL